MAEPLNNDDCVLAIPLSMQCPSCRMTFDTSGPRVEKLSKRQIMRQYNNTSTFSTSATKVAADEDGPSELPERSFITLTCGNPRCEQYNKFKVYELPRVKTSTARV